ncbi:holin [Acinetobacter indicus]|uniref:holin n=1 Tax=Acinetobacter indicus TaxID=756892 RepID=UPI0009488B00|nr:holin [Acinetobacter indicus]MCO8100497.1 phage holin family protein [Acinetobacter indicus]MCO8106035.1 phage holin family protein [Acinetobacter indicus]MCO8111709.1 phage holin family protein [Acinetobacter indicus]
MQEHEKNLMLLIVIGAAIGFAKLLVSDEKLTWRLIIGRTILGAATSTISGAIILQVPDINPLALIAIASALGILGSTFIENWLKSQTTRWGVK